MHRTAVFVDAGYIYAQSAVCLTGANANRSQLKLDESELINQSKSLAQTQGVGAQLLRIYWYDGAKNGMTVEQLVLADMPDVKVRLGSINSAGQQKGVDSLLVTDLIDLARNRAVSDALIVIGDGDMRIAVQIAQSFGVRVHLVGLEPSRASQSQLLRQESDSVHEISRIDVAKFMKHSGSLSQPAQLTASPQVELTTPEAEVSLDYAIERSLNSHLGHLSQDDMSDLQQVTLSSRRIPEQYDRRILGTCRAIMKRDLNDEERRSLRKRAVEYINQDDRG